MLLCSTACCKEKKRKIFLYDNNVNYGKESEVEGWRGNNL